MNPGINVKWILFDFGGCLDSDGVHSRKLFWDQFASSGLKGISQHRFQEAYSNIDQKIIKESLLLNFGLLQMNKLMCKMLAQDLGLQDIIFTNKVANAITQDQSFYLRRNKSLLIELQKNYRLGIISNFTGNLEIILNEFALTEHFDFVLDSYHVGWSKPSQEIFHLATKLSGTEAAHIAFVGDNPERDIRPAKLAGMTTVLLGNRNNTTEADYTLESLNDLLDITQRQ
jgi:HAD superfamily hydrolase (TIGR01549 family)